MRRNWDEKEDKILKDLIQIHGKQWNLISQHLKTRTPSQIAARWEKCLNPMIIKGPFTKEEDEIIKNYVNKNGPRSWPQITSLLPNRSSKQCRERWLNHLDPNVIKSPWTQEEDNFIFEQYKKFGSKWSNIAKLLPGRTDNAIKNRWNSSISKRISININGNEIILPDKTKRNYKNKNNNNNKTNENLNLNMISFKPFALQNNLKSNPAMEKPTIILNINSPNNISSQQTETK